uniref:CSC1/OSCA1-like 7TM region domain-containing protein n=1 Tax=Hemiselmis andersenii TaxID=464988 RepID=A0A6U4V9T7_HEMAN|mmetsp:Transcript_26979/g.65599  ORF Transcript_26979/g.65599 Transcript_26979/m.65599 type:complete len:772 (+) Transcript_26979:138-2453(+)
MLHFIRSWALDLVLHILVYLTLFLVAAFYAARSYRRRHDPEQAPFARVEEGKTYTPGNEEPPKRTSWRADHTEYTWSDAMSEFGDFAREPVPFLMETANVDDDAVHHRAGLEARLYLHFMKSMLMFFGVVAGLVMVVILPANCLNAKASWMPYGDYAQTTANGFRHPEKALVLHLLCSLFIATCVLVVVYLMREHLLSFARGLHKSEAATPPVQAYTVEMQGMRVSPPVTEAEVATVINSDPRLRQERMCIAIANDVTEIVDKVDEQKELIESLARYKEQLENEGVRPTMLVGPLSFVYCGERVDAIEHLQKGIRALDEDIDAARGKRLVGTGTAFVTFRTRGAAQQCVRVLGDARSSNKRLGVPSIGQGPTNLCRNPAVWSVKMASKPQDVCWRNLRYSAFQHTMLLLLGFVFLLVTLSFVVTPLFFIQVFLSLEQITEDEIEKGPQPPAHFAAFAPKKMSGGWMTTFVVSLLTPLSILFINFFVMPALVKWTVRHSGHRTNSGVRSSEFALVFFFMIVNLLFIPALSLGSLEELLEITGWVPLDKILASVVLYGSAGAFFIDYTAQCALLATAFYFMYHTNAPRIHDWASGGTGDKLHWNFDFSYFYSSILSVLAIGLMFSVTVPLLMPFVALCVFTRYYTDKWQLITAHSSKNPDPSPERTASSVFVSLILVAALAEAAFGGWLTIQGCNDLATFAWLASLLLLIVIAVPWTRRRFVTVSDTWLGGEDEHPETMDAPAPVSYMGSYENPYEKRDEAGGKRDSLGKHNL